MVRRMSSRAARGWIFQDQEFVFGELEGSTLERLLGHVDGETGAPLIVFLKTTGHMWQRFFLDAGLGFWGEYSEHDVAGELEEDAAIDYGHRFGVVGQCVGQARCEPGPRIRVAISSGDFVLETTGDSILDAPSSVRFESKLGA